MKLTVTLGPTTPYTKSFDAYIGLAVAFDVLAVLSGSTSALYLMCHTYSFRFEPPEIVKRVLLNGSTMRSHGYHEKLVAPAEYPTVYCVKLSPPPPEWNQYGSSSARATLELPLRHVLALRFAIVRFLYSPK